MSSPLGRRSVSALVLVVGLLALTPTSPAEGAAQAPPEVSGSSDWRQVSVGGTSACGVRTTGRLYCWGDNTQDQIGRGSDVASYGTPVEVSPGFANWTAVSVGGQHACARRATGQLYCWGSDAFGQVGDGGTNANRDVATLVAGGISDWTAVSAGARHTCGRRANGRLYCWGSNGSGQVGNLTENSLWLQPKLVAGGITDWTAVSAGEAHNCGRRANGQLWCWGSDTEGQLGNGGADTDANRPRLVSGAAGWTSVAAGGFRTCGRRTTGRLYCWGTDAAGGVGDGGGVATRTAPVLVAGGATNWTAVSSGYAHSCGRRSTGHLACWGDGLHGAVGDGTIGTNRFAPVTVAGHATDWTAVEGGDLSTCAITTARRLYCWGEDTAGLLGNSGADTRQIRPTETYNP
jgi:alpha-tubulin suppressor-like RCC1 family protein